METTRPQGSEASFRDAHMSLSNSQNIRDSLRMPQSTPAQSNYTNLPSRLIDQGVANLTNPDAGMVDLPGGGKFDPTGGIGGTVKAAPRAAMKVAERAPSWLHVLEKEGAHSFQAIHPDDFDNFKEIIDSGTKNIAQKLQDATGRSYHLTAADEGKMTRAGAKKVDGYASLGEIAKAAGVKITEVMKHVRETAPDGVKKHLRVKE